MDSGLASLQPNSARLIASSDVGSGVVELLDRNVGPGEMVKTPTSDLRVVLPASLELNCLPHKSWTVMEGSEVTVTVSILDEENNQIYSSDNLMMEVMVDSPEMFEVKERLSNGSLILGVPLQPGTVKVTARLVGAGDCQLASPLTASARLEIVPRMVLQPSESFLPWDPLTETQHLVQHSLLGGSGGGVTWSTTNTSVATTTQAGLTTVYGGELGQSSVVTQLTRHKHCQAAARVEVVPVTNLELAQSHQEFMVGSSLSLPVKMKFSAGEISSCQSLPLQSLQTEPAFSSSLTGGAEEGCASLVVTSQKVSSSKLTVSWSYPDLSGDLITLTDSKYLASYEELLPVYPALGETTVAVETEREVEWRGGPQPWPLQPGSHYSEVESSDESVLTTTRVASSAGGYVWRVRCLTAGETSVTLTVGNRPSSSLPSPVTASSSVTVTCAVPHTVSLSPSIPGPSSASLPPCPVQARQGRLAAHSYLDLRLEVSMKDSAGRNIDSIRGVKVDWAVSDQSLGSVVEAGGVLQDRENTAHQVRRKKWSHTSR